MPPSTPSPLPAVGSTLGLVLSLGGSPATAASDIHLIDHRWRPGHQAILTLQIEGPPALTPQAALNADCLRVTELERDGTAQPLNLLEVSTPRGSRWTRVTAQTPSRRSEPVSKLRIDAACEGLSFSRSLGAIAGGGSADPPDPTPAATPQAQDPTLHKLHRWLQPWLGELQQLRDRSRRERAEITLLRQRMVHRNGQTLTYGLFGLLVTVMALLGGLIVGLRAAGRHMWSPSLAADTPMSRHRPAALGSPRKHLVAHPPSPNTMAQGDPNPFISQPSDPPHPGDCSPGALDFALLERERPARTLDRVRHLRQDEHLGEAVLLLEHELQAAPGKSGWLLLELLDLYDSLGMQHPRNLVKSQIEALFAVDLSDDGFDAVSDSIPEPRHPDQTPTARRLLTGHADGRRLSLGQFRQALMEHTEAETLRPGPNPSDAHSSQHPGEFHQWHDAAGLRTLAPSLQVGHQLLG